MLPLKIPCLTLFPQKYNAILVRIQTTQGFLKENCKTIRKLSKALTDTLNNFAKHTS